MAANAHVYDAPVALAGFENTVFVFKRLANTKHGRLDSFFQVRTRVGAHTQATRTKEKNGDAKAIHILLGNQNGGSSNGGSLRALHHPVACSLVTRESGRPLWTEKSFFLVERNSRH